MNLLLSHLQLNGLPSMCLILAEAANAADVAGLNPLKGPVEYVATFLFALAILHTFVVKQFAKLAHKYPEGSIMENLFHFLAETEIVFGIWAAVLFFAIIVMKMSIHAAVEYVESLNYTEPKFVLVVMVVAATGQSGRNDHPLHRSIDAAEGKRVVLHRRTVVRSLVRFIHYRTGSHDTSCPAA